MILWSTVKLRIILSAFLLFASIGCRAQTHSLPTGTFYNTDRSISLQLKMMDKSYHGLMVSKDGTFAVKLGTNAAIVDGQIFGGNLVIDFKAKGFPGGIALSAQNYSEIFYHVSYEHSLQDLDLTSLFTIATVENKATSNSGAADPKSKNNGRTEDTAQKPSTTVSRPSKAMNKDNYLYPHVVGSQLMHHRRSRGLSSSRSSFLNFINFCPDGTFIMSIDASFVAGEINRTDSVIGMTNGAKTGTWNIEEKNGGLVAHIYFDNGGSTFYRISEAQAKEGRWRIGNNKFVLQKNKAQCK